MTLHWLIWLGIGLFNSTTEQVHEFHISKCVIEYAEAEAALQVTMYVFIDDLELALAEQATDQLFICTEKEHEEAETFMAKYFDQHFKIFIDKQPVALSFLGKEISEDFIAAWCYLEGTNVETIQSLTIQNSILVDQFDDQKNIISVIGPGNQQEFVMLEKNKTQETFTF